jgi:NADH-quinone oxidoreductase subunit C
MKQLIDKIQNQYQLQDVFQQRDNLVFVTVDKHNAIDLITHLRDYEGFSHFVVMSCVDWIEDNKLQLTYILNNPEHKYDVAIRTMIERDQPEMTSAHHLWKQIWTYQRELREAFGIQFPGSPRVDENFVLEGWTDKPHMLRDFDTHEYAEKTYFPRDGRSTNDPATYMREKLYPNQPVTAKKNENAE